jgi:AcrR family transcriptional regulator
MNLNQTIVSNFHFKRLFDILLFWEAEMDETSPNAISPKGKGEQTKHHLIDAAQRLFAEQGFRRTSVRDIANAAGSNVAAVNYHFGSKENLYREVFLSHKKKARERGVAAISKILEESQGSPNLGEVLESFALAARKGRDSTDTRVWRMLIERELVERQLDPRFVFEEVLAPIEKALSKAIEAACPGVPPKAVHRCVHSFWAQLDHLRRFELYFGDIDNKELPWINTKESIRHIVKFTSAGIQAHQKQKRGVH